MCSTATAPATPVDIDLYTAVHKALRLVLFQTTLALARADFDPRGDTPPGEVGRLLARCFGFVREHGDHEDAEILPTLARLDPDLAAELAAEHVALEKAAITIESMVPRIAGDSGPERPAMVAELLRRSYLFVAEQLRHLDREEHQAGAVLARGLTSDARAGIRARILARMAPARLAEWAELLVEALTPAELAHMRA